MPSASNTGKPSRSSSAIVADRPSGYHDLKIDACLLDARSIPAGQFPFLMSCPFTVGDHRWRIKIFPNGDRADADGYVSVYLLLDDEVIDKPVTVQMQFAVIVEKRALFFLKKKKEEVTPSTKAVATFAGQQGVWGYSKFAKREEVLKQVRRGKGHRPSTIRCAIVVHNGYHALVMKKSSMSAPSPSSSVPVPPSNLSAHLGDLLSSERGADVVFEVGRETFAAHRAVLAARSPVFSLELFSAMRESDDAAGVVRVDGMEPRVFQALLRFVYTDTLPEMMTKKEEDAMYQHLLVAADRYDMERLKLMCEEKLCRFVDMGTAAIILTLAEQHHCDRLKKACLDFVTDPANLKAVVRSDGFEHLSTSCPSIRKDLIAMLA